MYGQVNEGLGDVTIDLFGICCFEGSGLGENLIELGCLSQAWPCIQWQYLAVF